MSSPEYEYRVVDVFTETPLEGNPLAVLPRASGLDSATMQRIAREFNLSETVFILPSEHRECAARFRIFTPTMEMRFAGHPTVGGAYVALECGLVDASSQRFSIEESIGAVPVRVEQGDPLRIWLKTPPIEFGPAFNRPVCAEVLGLTESELGPAPPQRVSAGNPTIFVPVRDHVSVDRAWLDLGGVRRLHDGQSSSDCVFVFAPTATGAYSRMFAPEHGMVEDPATGSATGPLAAYMMRYGLVSNEGGTRFISEQGTKMGRRSLLHVAIHGANGDGGIEVGGNVVPIAEGSLRLP
ncbi:MAG: PhzF family phenazine biosynthesis protein [Candidatus Eremiobacteraeota bacterium]|nr:PhzF family phenazine biosynthesis protein [Candidatus Eremiobacteraeota bacterium]